VSRRAWTGAGATVLAALALAHASQARTAGLTLTVKAVPALQGLDFAVDGQRYTTPKSGVVAIPIAAGTHRVVALRWRHRDRGIRVDFSRWSDDSFEPGRTVTVDRSRTLEVGYGVSYLRGLSFFDCVKADTTEARTGCEDNLTRPVSRSRVTSVTLVNSIGEKFPLTSDQREWLEGVRVARRLNGLEETLITYSVMEVMVGGSDVVNQAQQRFYLAKPKKTFAGQALLPVAAKTFRIRLSLYDAHFSTHDLLLRGPIGQVLQLTYPDGRKRQVPLDNNGEVSLHSMPRGLYQVKVKTSAGIPMEVPVSLSKNQDMQLKVISYADVGGSFLLFGLISIVLVTARRPTLRSAIRRRVSRLGRNWRRAMQVGR
jgi:hypothetical protein